MPLLVAACTVDTPPPSTANDAPDASFHSVDVLTDAAAHATHPDSSPHSAIAAKPALAAHSPPADAVLTADASTQATVDAHDLDAPYLLNDFLADDTAGADKPRRRRRSPGPHERRLPDVPEDTSASDREGNPWPRDDARSSDYAPC